MQLELKICKQKIYLPLKGFIVQRLLLDAIIQEWRENSIAQEAFCKQKNLSYPAFLYQKRKAREEKASGKYFTTCKSYVESRECDPRNVRFMLNMHPSRGADVASQFFENYFRKN